MITDTIEQMETALKIVRFHLNLIQLDLNEGKCEQMHINQGNVKINNIPNVEKLKYLGHIIDKDLSHKGILEVIRNKLDGIIYIYRARIQSFRFRI